MAVMPQGHLADVFPSLLGPTLAGPVSEILYTYLLSWDFSIIPRGWGWAVAACAFGLWLLFLLFLIERFCFQWTSNEVEELNGECECSVGDS